MAALGIIVAFAQLMIVFVLLYKYFLPITILGWIFHICVLLYLINRDEIPELKIPWLIILFLLPVVGAFVFMLLSSNDTMKKDYMRYEIAAKELAPYLRQTGNIQALREQNEDAYT